MGTFGSAKGGKFGKAAIAYLEWQMKNDKIAGKQFTAPSTSPLTGEGWDIVSKNGERIVRRGTIMSGDVSANMLSAINSVENRRRSVVI